MNKIVIKYLLSTFIIMFCVEMLFGFTAMDRSLAIAREGEVAIDTIDSTVLKNRVLFDTTRIDSALKSDTVKTVAKPFLDDIISGSNKDSLVFDVKTNYVYIYRDGDVKYQDMSLKADYMSVNLSDKNILAYGYRDTAGYTSRPEFNQAGATYAMDTIHYNLSSQKAKIKGMRTQEGEGFLLGKEIKKMPDNSINIANGKYTTCPDTLNPHFYLALTKGKSIDGKTRKLIFGPAYLVIEDVPIYFIGLPFGFFPMSNGRQSGFIMPSYGEEAIKGFFLRDGGYYFAFNDYVDATFTGGFYSLGSWEANVASQYTKRYKYNGRLNLKYSKDIIGEKWMQDYTNQNNFNVTWTHSQDSKFRPNSTFSANVNFATSGYAKNGATNLDQYLNTQTNSSIAYSKSWAGTPFSFSTNLSASQNSSTQQYNITFPSAVFSMSRIYPLKRKNPVGKQKWYEKISMNYTGSLTNSASALEDELFTETMFKGMKNGINHSIPISTNMNILKYINISPSMNYTERWYFQRTDQTWNETTNSIDRDTVYGFNRVWNYNVAASASTKVYGTFLFSNKSLVRAIRHVMTPNISLSYAPNFGDQKYGYYLPIQQDSTGRMGTYSPFTGGTYGVPGQGESASLSFGLNNTLEMKVKSDKDTTGVRKIKLIDNLSISSAYNFLADSLNLSPFALGFRATLTKSLGISVTGQLDPYDVDPTTGSRINTLAWKRGSLGRLSSVNWSFGYTFNNSQFAGNRAVINDINSNRTALMPEYNDPFANSADMNNKLTPEMQRILMTQQYYDFSIPWNFGFNYSFNYKNSGVQRDVIQTFGFNTSVTLTEKWGLTFNGGYDFEGKSLTPGVVNITRDLHCWQMNLSWVPIGYRKSWNFEIAVKSDMLKDIKYEKSQSFYDNLNDF